MLIRNMLRKLNSYISKESLLLTEPDKRLLLVIKARWFIIALLAVHGIVNFGAYVFSHHISSPALGVAHFLYEFGEVLLKPALVVTVIFAYNLFYHIGWYKLPSLWIKRVKLFIFAQLFIDILAILLLIHYTGGITSWLWPLFLVLNLELAFLLPTNQQALLLGALTGTGYSTLAVLEYTKIIGSYQAPYVHPGLQYNLTYMILTLLWVNLICGFTCLVGLFLHQKENENLRERIIRDGLTSLYNRRYFNYRLNSEIKRAQRYHRLASLIIFDIDDFKKYNDKYGHVQGDSLLQWVANIFKLNIRRSDEEPAYEIDIACRYGGEEFAIILPEIGTDISSRTAEKIRREIELQTSGAISLAERIRTTVEAAKFRNGKGITVSAGIACYPLDGQNQKQLIEAADKALYLAKRKGKNRVVVATKTRQKPKSIAL